MGIFDKIKHAIFGGPAVAATMPDAKTSAPAAPAQAPAAAGTTSSPSPASPQATAAASSAAASTSPGAGIDIGPILDQAVKKSGQKLDWRHSIVDLMKAVGMDASLAERKELATELHYTGDMNDSAKMNMWLHKALMKKLAENGGKVPADLMD